MDYDHQAGFARIYGFTSPPALGYFGLFAPQGSEFAPLGKHCEDGFYLLDIKHKSDVSFSDEFMCGKIYIQDYASFEAARIFCELVSSCTMQPLELLDMCAAPGGKTNAIYHLLSRAPKTLSEEKSCSKEFKKADSRISFLASGDSRLIDFSLAANEANRKRFFLLQKQLKLLGVNARTFNHDGTLIGRKCPQRFSGVLLDAPCSCNAHDFSVTKSAKEIKKISLLQKKLLHSALQATRPGGVVLYSTCSYNEEENESVIQNALNSKLACKMIEISSKLPHILGADSSLRVIPTEQNSGFFIAALRRQED